MSKRGREDQNTAARGIARKGAAHTRDPRQPAAPLPLRAAVLRLLEHSPQLVHARDIARALNLDAAARLVLKRLLRELAEEGALPGHRRAAPRADHLPDVIVADIVARDVDGDLRARPLTLAEGQAAPVIVLAAARMGHEALNVGDRALLRLSRQEVPEQASEAPVYLARVIKKLPTQQRRVLGIFRLTAGGERRVVPIDKKARGEEWLVRDIAPALALEDGDLVAAEPLRHARAGLTPVRIIEKLGAPRSERAISTIAIHAHEIPHVFAQAALEEAAAARAATLAGRTDWRALPLITIDPADAKDHDDAVHAQADTDKANPGGFVLHIAIADVAAYVTPGSAMDEEAQIRGNSVYFPDRVVPMLPEPISNDLCSLKPGVNRPAMGLEVVIDAQGRKKHHRFARVLMRSCAKLSYQEAQAAVDGSPQGETGALVEPVLRPLFSAYDALVLARKARAPLELDLPERKILLDDKGEVRDVITPERLDAHRLIEEFMVLANVCAAETLEAARTPLLYRIHDEPDGEKLTSLRAVLASIGLNLTAQGALTPAFFNRILAQVAGSPNAALINETVLRSQAQAEYSPDNLGHFGLNLRRYAHFTSPIRRYADLIVHRALIATLGLGADGLPAGVTRETLKGLGERLCVAERRAMVAERETIDRLIALFLADRIGATFAGRIAGVTRAGLFVRLAQTGADGFVPVATLGGDYYRFEESARALVGARTGESYRLGDDVTVRLVEAAPMAGALRFEILSEGRIEKSAGRKSGKPSHREPLPSDQKRGKKPYGRHLGKSR